MLPLPSMDTVNNAHRAASHEVEATQGPPPRRLAANKRPPGGVGRQTAQAHVVAKEMRDVAGVLTELATTYDHDNLTEPAELLRNEAGNLRSYADLVLNGPVPAHSQGGPLVTATVFGDPLKDEQPVDRTVGGMGLLDLPTTFSD